MYDVFSLMRHKMCLFRSIIWYTYGVSHILPSRQEYQGKIHRLCFTYTTLFLKAQHAYLQTIMLEWEKINLKTLNPKLPTLTPHPSPLTPHPLTHSPLMPQASHLTPHASPLKPKYISPADDDTRVKDSKLAVDAAEVGCRKLTSGCGGRSFVR